MASKDYPSWAYLLAGLLIGLFVAFLVYLQSQPVDLKKESDKPATTPEKKEPNKSPKFEFYKILPELEVVIPDLDIISNNKEKPPANNQAKKPIAIVTNEKLVLQVGSFNDIQQAERMKASLALLGLEAQIQRVTVDNTSWHRVRLGPYTDRTQLAQDNRRLRDHNIQAITLRLRD